ncbi:MAG: type II restriction endonuclease [Clostridia bacterium]|nr:type II restriction endonuclease [Clostridia bacterium]
MSQRDFKAWLSGFDDSIASWKYYTDFDKVYKHVNSIKNEINLLNGLIGSKDIEKDFENLIKEYPNVIKAIPILIAKRENIIIIKDAIQDYYFNFKKMNYTLNDYITFMRKTGIFGLLENHLVSSLYDYVTGVEVGMDTNARKNRTGHAMEDLVESYIIKAGFTKEHNYYKEVSTTMLKEKWNVDLREILKAIDSKSLNKNMKMAEKRFDFVIEKNDILYLIETNFYASPGSKLNETARSYKMLNSELSKVNGIKFIWLTDGTGWNTARNNLEETFNEMQHIYCIKDLKENIIEKIL